MNVHYAKAQGLLFQFAIFMCYPHMLHNNDRDNLSPGQFPQDWLEHFPFFSHLINHVRNQMNDNDVIFSITWRTVYFVFKKKTV